MGKKTLFIAVVLLLVSTVAFASQGPPNGGNYNGNNHQSSGITQFQTGGLTVTGGVYGCGTSHATTSGSLALGQYASTGKGTSASQNAYGQISATGSSFGWGSSVASWVCGFFGFTQAQSVK